MNFSVRRYWAFQLIGWGVFVLINLFFAFLFNQVGDRMLFRLIFFVEIGIIFTHLMREAIHRMALVMKPLQQQKQGGAVEIAVAVIQVRGANG